MCLNPNYAIYIKRHANACGILEQEKDTLKFIKLRPEDNYKSLKEKYQDRLLSLPCGRCEQCRRDYATQWATRIALEASKYKNNWFITLTYDNNHYRKLNKEDIQDFLEKLGGHNKREFKYWLAGEYGPTTGRAHYHMILINYDIQAKPICQNSARNTIFESEIITKAWGKGYCQIQEAGNNAAAYCAKYASKSATEVNFRPMMSKGIGLEELINKQDFINKYGYIQGQAGKKFKIPRYYFKKIQTAEAKKRKEEQIKKAKQKTAEKVRYRHLEYSLLEEAELCSKTKGRRSAV